MELHSIFKLDMLQASTNIQNTSVATKRSLCPSAMKHGQSTAQSTAQVRSGSEPDGWYCFTIIQSFCIDGAAGGKNRDGRILLPIKSFDPQEI